MRAVALGSLAAALLPLLAGIAILAAAPAAFAWIGWTVIGWWFFFGLPSAGARIRLLRPCQAAPRAANRGGLAWRLELEQRVDRAFVEDWAARYLEAWNSGDGSAVASLCTEDVSWFDPGLPEVVHGRDAVRQFVEDTHHGFSDFHVEELGAPLISETEPLVMAAVSHDWDVHRGVEAARDGAHGSALLAWRASTRGASVTG